jgi:hypothetical protein
MQVSIDARESNVSVASIAQLDMVKRNVESACSTLSEATELSSLFVKVIYGVCVCRVCLRACVCLYVSCVCM